MVMMISPLTRWPNLVCHYIPGLNEFIKEQVNIFSSLPAMVLKEIGKFIEFLKKPDFSIHGMINLFSPILEFILDFSESLIMGALNFLVLALKGLEKAFTQTIDIPFLTPLYKFITGLLGESEAFSLLNGFSLLFSVPFTIIYKIIHGRAPFKDGSQGLDEEELYDYLFNSASDNGQKFINDCTSVNIEGGYTQQNKQFIDNEALENYVNTGGVIGCCFSLFSGVIGCTAKLSAHNAALNNIHQIIQGVVYVCLIPIPPKLQELEDDEQHDDFPFRWAQYSLSIVGTYILSRDKTSVLPLVNSILLLALNITANCQRNPGTDLWIGNMMSRAASVGSNIGGITENGYITAVSAGLALGGSSTSLYVAGSKRIVHGTVGDT
jgi:hypothetical protein